MATNPMQRKARNSFLLGMLLMLIITGAIIALLVLQLINIKKEEKEAENSNIKVYVLNKNVKSGAEITLADLTETVVNKENAPTDYLTPSGLGTKNISKEMLYIDESSTGNDVRKEEYNMFILPSDLVSGDYVDVRLLLPGGTNYIVVSKKKVEIPEISGVLSTNTISLELSEDEINMLSNAIVEAFKTSGAKLYVNKYTDPGVQEAAIPTYPPNREVMELIDKNPNVVEEAKTDLYNRYNTDQRNNIINPAVTNENAQDNLETNMEESITNSLNTRQEYLEGLSAGMSSTY